MKARFGTLLAITLMALCESKAATFTRSMDLSPAARCPEMVPDAFFGVNIGYWSEVNGPALAASALEAGLTVFRHHPGTYNDPHTVPGALNAYLAPGQGTLPRIHGTELNWAENESVPYTHALNLTPHSADLSGHETNLAGSRYGKAQDDEQRLKSLQAPPGLSLGNLDEFTIRLTLRADLGSDSAFDIILKSGTGETLARRVIIPGQAWAEIEFPLNETANDSFNPAVPSVELIVTPVSNLWPLQSASYRIDDVHITRSVPQDTPAQAWRRQQFNDILPLGDAAETADLLAAGQPYTHIHPVPVVGRHRSFLRLKVMRE